MATNLDERLAAVEQQLEELTQMMVDAQARGENADQLIEESQALQDMKQDILVERRLGLGSPRRRSDAPR